MGSYGHIKHFTDPQVWKLARELRRKVYALTARLPEEEKYNLTSQMRRAGVSTTSNLAEGFGRFHYQEMIQFSRQSRGSVYEIEDDVITCYDENYIPRDDCADVYQQAEHTARAINGLIRWLMKQKKAAKRDTLRVQDFDSTQRSLISEEIERDLMESEADFDDYLQTKVIELFGSPNR